MARPALKIWFDGGCRPNPGPMETAVVAGGQTYLRTQIGTGDNNDAEWLAALHALQVAHDLGAAEVTLLGDSALVVGQASAAARCRGDRFQTRLAEFQALAVAFARVRIRRIGRAQNLAGIALERLHGRL
jgi:ribonuclease HI